MKAQPRKPGSTSCAVMLVPIERRTSPRPEGGRSMNIGVLGAGRMTEALAPHWIAAGHDVLVAGRRPGKAADLAQRLGARSGTLRDAAQFGDVVLLAVLYVGIDATLDAAGPADGTLCGKVLIDCNNPVETEHFTLVSGVQPSLAQYLAARTGARVVKALHQVHSQAWQRRAAHDGRPLVVPIAGDDDARPSLPTWSATAAPSQWTPAAWTRPTTSRPWPR
jgi:predicted dinucleotide-binding enzyme